MPTAAQQRRATSRALDILSNWTRTGTHEGISFSVSRISDDLFTESFLGGGDASRFTAIGRRGKLTSQLSNANILNSGGGPPHQFPIQFVFDLNAGKANGNWNNPATGLAEHVAVTLTYFKTATVPEGKYYLFYGAKTSDKTAYSFAFLLL